jgi:predicted P-loop ATPase
MYGRDRDQLWAEAVVACRAGEAWWLDREAETEAAAITSQRQPDDPWESVVLGAVIGKTHTSTREVLGAVGVDTVHRTKHDAQRVAGILNRAGWVREGKYTSGLDRGLARYVRPPSGEPQWGTS